MPDTPPDIAALIGSRICHDLISPLGAIGNGVELLAMTAAGGGPEMALIAESVASANARIRFFRLAFGSAAAGGMVPPSEVHNVLADMTRGGRLRIRWQIAGDLPRPRVKLAFLALQCLETALPWGGQITVRDTAGGWRVEAEAARLSVDEALWAGLAAAAPAAGIAPAEVQFALLPAEAARQGRTVTWSRDRDRIAIDL